MPVTSKLVPEDKTVTFAELKKYVEKCVKDELPDDARFKVTTYKFTGHMSSIEAVQAPRS